MKKFICLFLLVLTVCSCATPVSAVDSALGMAVPMTTVEAVETVEMSNTSLSQSTFHSWNDLMLTYNCYAFALGRADLEFPYPGSISGVITSYNGEASIETMAEHTKFDLIELGYNCVKLQTNVPSSVGSWYNVIAIRKEMVNTTPLQPKDYHYAKLTSEGWLHKPGDTAVLKFNQPPSSDDVWVQEALKYGYEYGLQPDVYDGTIIFILYKASHFYGDSVWTYNHYHSGSKHYYEYSRTCTGCGHVVIDWTNLPCTGSSCVMPWSTTPNVETE